MGLLVKNKEKKLEKEPQYYMSATGNKMYNYKVYHMTIWESVIYFILAFAIGAAVGYLFYGGIGKDEFGQATSLTWTLNLLICSFTGFLTGRLYVPIRVKQMIHRQKKELNTQFRDMLEAFTTSLGAGNNVVDSFTAVYNDMGVQYDESAYILNELDVIISGIHNNIDLEELLLNFGERSGNEDIISFADVFNICYRKGGNIQDVIRNTHSILSEKMEIREDIETMVTSNKTEQNMMVAMPIGIIGVIKMMSPEFASNFVSVAGIIATTIGIACFVGAYYVGKEILDMKV